MDIFLSEVPYSVKSEIPAGQAGRRNPKSETNPKSKILNKRNDFILFSESNSRFIVEVEKKNQKKFETLLKGLPFGLIGCLNKSKDFKVFGLDNKICVQAGIGELKEAWQKPLRW
jgi:phosphoribosylformylglycinamidine (FGAM) synthase-like enzyme